MIEVIALKTFTRATKKLFKPGDIEILAKVLQETPEIGVIIQGSGGVRKMRFSTTAGKSGGLRIVYFFLDSKDRVYLITAYAKNEQENLTKAQINELKKLTEYLK